MLRQLVRAVLGGKGSVSPDPVKHCEVFKSLGCAHVDGPLCDMQTCNIQVKATITPYAVNFVSRKGYKPTKPKVVKDDSRQAEVM